MIESTRFGYWISLQLSSLKKFKWSLRKALIESLFIKVWFDPIFLRKVNTILCMDFRGGGGGGGAEGAVGLPISDKQNIPFLLFLSYSKCL